jgi:hypothetical protein
MPEVILVKVPKKKYSVWKSIGKGLITGLKGVLVLAPVIADQVIPTLQSAGVKVSTGVLVALAAAKAINNWKKNKDNGTPNEKND